MSVHRDNNLLLNTFVTKGAVFNYQWEVCGGESQTCGFWEFTIKEDLIPESTAETLLPECPQEEEHPSETVGFLLQLYR